MRRINYFAMSLLASAALVFTGCSSEDLVGGDTQKNETGDFYMTMTIQTPQATTTRTEQKNEHSAITGEYEVNSGTFYVTDTEKNVVYTKTMTPTEWTGSKVPTESTTGSTKLIIPVKNVKEGVTYNVYFLANTTDDAPWTSAFTASSKFTSSYGTPSTFAMFNQNDKSLQADAYKVSFTETNKNKDKAAAIDGDKVIKIERITARIDEPKSGATTIATYKPADGEELTTAKIEAMEDAKARVESISLVEYAIANLAKTTNIMQQWSADYNTLLIPTTEYWQRTSEFGTATKIENADYFKVITDKTAEAEYNKDYVFENNVAGTDNATSMYFMYKINLKNVEGETKDCTDGTFYRFENKIYTSIADIFKHYENQSLPFGEGATAESIKAELKITNGEIGADAEELSKFRKDHQIEVFVAGCAYYSTIIQDQYHKENGHNLIQRNSIYQLTVKNVYNIGADVPNGNPDDVNPMYYLDVKVEVNPWVLNEQSVDLK